MAVSTNRDQWVNTFAKTIGATTGNTGLTGNEGGDSENNNALDKYESLQYTSYKDMLSSKIQASIARDQGTKYANTALAGAGYGTQGLAESTKTGIYNQYANAIQAADQTHQANMLDIEAQRAEDAEVAGEEKWQSAMSMLQQASSQEDIQYIKDNFYDGFTEDQKKYFDYYAASYGNGLGDSSVPTTSEYSYANETVYAYDKNGGSVVSEGRFDVENQTLNSAIATGKIAKGTFIQLHNLENESVYLYYGNDGKLYYVNQNTFNGSNNKVNIHGRNSAVNNGAYSA